MGKCFRPGSAQKSTDSKSYVEIAQDMNRHVKSIDNALAHQAKASNIWRKNSKNKNQF